MSNTNDRFIKRSFQQCSRCVMDTSVKGIYFDVNGVCNYCTDFLEHSSHIILEKPEQKAYRLEQLIGKVKENRKDKAYDCIVGVSGGVDSSWALVQAVKLGLKPLAVHMDNGWNSELSQNNIANLVRRLGVDLYTHVIDWNEYRGLMQAFFDADVIDIELLYDNAMLAVNYQQAKKYGVHYILSGSNQVTEGLSLPKGWNWFKYDKRNIRAIGKQFGSIKLATFPAIGVLDYLYYVYVKKIHWVSFLDYFPYNKFEVLDILEKEYQYKRYPYKHYESIFTRFYQGYILPNKFGVDKRLVHLSTLVVTGQMDRDEAIKDLESIAYPSKQALEEDIQYFLKKMNWSKDQLEAYILRPGISHTQYPSEKWLMEKWFSLVRVTPRFLKNIFKY